MAGSTSRQSARPAAISKSNCAFDSGSASASANSPPLKAQQRLAQHRRKPARVHRLPQRAGHVGKDRRLVPLPQLREQPGKTALPQQPHVLGEHREDTAHQKLRHPPRLVPDASSERANVANCSATARVIRALRRDGSSASGSGPHQPQPLPNLLP
jgi:hypothetical protein